MPTIDTCVTISSSIPKCRQRVAYNILMHTPRLQWLVTEWTSFVDKYMFMKKWNTFTRREVHAHFQTSVFSHFSSDWPGSGHDIIGVSNGPADAANCMTIGIVMGWTTVKFKWPPVGRQWGWWAKGAADSGFGGLMGQLTGQVEMTTSQPTVGLVG